jgi:hypothetical protein
MNADNFSWLPAKSQPNGNRMTRLLCTYNAELCCLCWHALHSTRMRHVSRRCHQPCNLSNTAIVAANSCCPYTPWCGDGTVMRCRGVCGFVVFFLFVLFVLFLLPLLFTVWCGVFFLRLWCVCLLCGVVFIFFFLFIIYQEEVECATIMVAVCDT